MNYTSAIHVVLAALVAVATAACDPGENKQGAAAAGSVASAAKPDPSPPVAATPPGPNPADYAAVVAAEATGAAAGAGGPATVGSADLAHMRQLLGDYESCATSCFADPSSKKATNIETCRLNCTNVAESAGLAAGSPAHKVMDRYDVCLGECYVDPKTKETDRETCKLNCAAVFETLETEVRSSAGPAPSGEVATTECAQKCVNEAVTCEQGCDELHVKETDRATCRLTCKGTSQLCVDKCGDAKTGK